MSGETEKSVSGWTVGTYAAHNEALRQAEARFQAERDLRYTQLREADQRALEIKSAGEKEAKRIKEEADSKALTLERETQSYKDEKANELREQISRERGLYVTQQELKGVTDKIDATMKPILDFVATQQGEKGGKLSQQQLYLFVIPGFVLFLITVIGAIVAVAYAIKN